MSVLYQALKRRDEIERGIHGGALFAAPASSSRPFFWIATVSMLVMLVGGLYVYATVRANAGPRQPVVIATLPDPEPVAKDIDDIDQIAAMMPAGAQVPLPVPPVQVSSGASDAALQARARQLQAQGATKAALKIYQQQGGDFTAQINQWGLVAETDAARAVPRLKALVRERPDNAAAHAQLGLAYIRAQQLDDAEAELTIASTLDPQDGQIWYNLAVLADQMSHRTLAENAYQNAVQHGGSNPPYDIATVQRRLNYLRMR